MRSSSILTLSALLLISIPASAGQDVPLESLPEAARITVQRETKGGTVTEIELENKQGKPSYYEVEFSVSGAKYEIHVAPDGRLLLRKAD
jgi:uncharacterized membrane protein YkoI